MPYTSPQVIRLSRRLGLVEALQSIVQQLTEPLLAEGVLEAAPANDIVLTRELLALLKSTMQGLRAKSSATSSAATLTRADVAAAYFQSQQIAGILGQLTRKVAALRAGAIEGATIPQDMKDTWQAGLDADLTALDTVISQLPNEK